MFWLLASLLNWNGLLLSPATQSTLRFFLPDSQQTYRERRTQVATIHLLYEQIDRISQPLGPRTPYKHAPEQLRRICFLALSMQVLKYNRKAFKRESPKALEAYNYGVS